MSKEELIEKLGAVLQAEADADAMSAKGKPPHRAFADIVTELAKVAGYGSTRPATVRAAGDIINAMTNCVLGSGVAALLEAALAEGDGNGNLH